MRSSRRCGPHCQTPETRACTSSATTRLSSPGLTGRSSTPRLLGWTRPSLEYRVARSSRAMTAVFVSSTGVGPAVGTERTRNDEAEIRFKFQTADTRPHSRGGRRPRFAFRCPSKEGAGNAGCALHPRSRVQKAERKSHTSIQGSGGNPTFPAQWLYGLFRALPGVSGFLASVASRKPALWPGWAFAPPLRLDANH